MRIRITLCIFFLGLASGCASFATRGDLSSDELEDFRARLLGTVIQELDETGKPALIRELKITSSRRYSDGSVALGYHLDFETQDSDSGKVSHRLDSVATIEPDRFQLSDSEQVTVWRLVRTTGPAEGLEFHDPVLIESRLPATGSP